MTHYKYDDVMKSNPMRIVCPSIPMIDDVTQWWKLDSNTNKKLLSISERRLLNIKTKKRK